MTIGLHWIIAIGMIAMIAFGLYIEGLPKGPDKSALIGLHKSFGLLILVLASTRFGWRLTNGMPQPVGQYTVVKRVLAKIVYWILLLGTLLMPVSGMTMSLSGGFGLSLFGLEIVPFMRQSPGFKPNEMLGGIGHVAHSVGGWLLISAVILHVAGAFKHHIVDRDGTLRRMVGGRA